MLVVVLVVVFAGGCGQATPEDDLTTKLLFVISLGPERARKRLMTLLATGYETGTSQPFVLFGAVLEGAPALIIFGPLLLPVAVKLGINPLHFGVVLVIAMGIGLFAPPLGLGLYGACLIGKVPIEQTVKPILGYLGLLFVCLVVIALVPAISTALPHALGY